MRVDEVTSNPQMLGEDEPSRGVSKSRVEQRLVALSLNTRAPRDSDSLSFATLSTERPVALVAHDATMSRSSGEWDDRAQMLRTVRSAAMPRDVQQRSQQVVENQDFSKSYVANFAYKKQQTLACRQQCTHASTRISSNAYFKTWMCNRSRRWSDRTIGLDRKPLEILWKLLLFMSIRIRNSKVLDENKDHRQSAQHVRGNKSLSETVESQNQDVSCIVPPVLVSKLIKHATQIFEAQYRESRCADKLNSTKASKGTQLAQVCREAGCTHVVGKWAKLCGQLGNHVGRDGCYGFVSRVHPPS